MADTACDADHCAKPLPPRGPPSTLVTGFNDAVSAVAKPSTWAMRIAGFVGLSFVAYQRRNRALASRGVLRRAADNILGPLVRRAISWHYSSLRNGEPMKLPNLIVTASLVIGTTAVATMNSAEARRYRHSVAYNDYVGSEGTCSAPPPRPTYVYPAANWEPFFRRHLYRYGPILICEPALQPTNVISVRY
jgi:hypothetical protein